jgi:hypothetical protein
VGVFCDCRCAMSNVACSITAVIIGALRDEGGKALGSLPSRLTV